MKKIAIFGTPRSGTSWLAHIFNSHPDVLLRFQPLFSYGHKGRLNNKSSSEDIQNFFIEIINSSDPFATMSSKEQKNYPVFQKSSKTTHIVFKETRYLNIIENLLTQSNEIKVIGIVRNPLAVLVSWFRAPNEFNKEWDINCEWRMAQSKNQDRPEEFYGFEKWRESTEQFLRFREQFSQKFFLVRYDELNSMTSVVVKNVFNFCELEVCAQVQKFLIESKSRHDSDPYSVFRANANDDSWKNVLPDTIVEHVVLELKHTPLSIFLKDLENA